MKGKVFVGIPVTQDSGVIEPDKLEGKKAKCYIARDICLPSRASSFEKRDLHESLQEIAEEEMRNFYMHRSQNTLAA